MWETQIEAGDKIVVDSGFVTSFGDELVRVTMQKFVPGQEKLLNDLTFIFEFRDNGNEPESEMVEVSNSELKFILYNHRSGGVRMGGTSPRIGPIEPLEVGETEPLDTEQIEPLDSEEFRRYKILLNYQVSSRGGQESPTKATDLYYTIYLTEPDNNTGE